MDCPLHTTTRSIVHCSQRLHMKYNCAAHACVARNDYAVALLRAGKVDRAIAEFLVGLENDPESPFLHKNLAAAYARKGQYKQALVHAREAARKDPSVR